MFSSYNTRRVGIHGSLVLFVGSSHFYFSVFALVVGLHGKDEVMGTPPGSMLLIHFPVLAILVVSCMSQFFPIIHTGSGDLIFRVLIKWW